MRICVNLFKQKKNKNKKGLIGFKKEKKVLHEIKVTAFGRATRTELKSGKKWNGIIHFNESRGSLCIIWYDENEGKQHYWKRNKCKTYDQGQCRFPNTCKFAHIDQLVIDSLQSKYVSKIHPFSHLKQPQITHKTKKT